MRPSFNPLLRLWIRLVVPNSKELRFPEKTTFHWLLFSSIKIRMLIQSFKRPMRSSSITLLSALANIWLNKKESKVRLKERKKDPWTKSTSKDLRNLSQRRRSSSKSILSSLDKSSKSIFLWEKWQAFQPKMNQSVPKLQSLKFQLRKMLRRSFWRLERASNSNNSSMQFSLNKTLSYSNLLIRLWESNLSNSENNSLKWEEERKVRKPDNRDKEMYKELSLVKLRDLILLNLSIQFLIHWNSILVI